MAPVEGAALAVEVVFSPGPRLVERVELNLPPGSTVQEAVDASGLLQRHASALGEGVTLALWGRAVDSTTVLRERDRVELLRPLRVDPKEARRLRYRSQAERRTTRRR
jgi:uncharacterized protein